MKKYVNTEKISVLRKYYENAEFYNIDPWSNLPTASIGMRAGVLEPLHHNISTDVRGLGGEGRRETLSEPTKTQSSIMVEGETKHSIILTQITTTDSSSARVVFNKFAHDFVLPECNDF